MKKSIGAGTYAVPSPVWIVGTYDDEGKPNMMTVAWSGICCSKPPCIYVSLRKATYSYGSIMKRKAYTVNIPGEIYWKKADYVGCVSGRDTDKFKDTELNSVRSDLIDAPYIAEFPLILECKVKEVVELGLHTMFVGEIIDTKVDEEMLTDDKPDINKIKPIIFDIAGRGYRGVGPRIGDSFGTRSLP